MVESMDEEDLIYLIRKEDETMDMMKQWIRLQYSEYDPLLSHSAIDRKSMALDKNLSIYCESRMRKERLMEILKDKRR